MGPRAWGVGHGAEGGEPKTEGRALGARSVGQRAKGLERGAGGKAHVAERVGQILASIQLFDLGFRIADFGLKKKQPHPPTQILQID